MMSLYFVLSYLQAKIYMDVIIQEELEIVIITSSQALVLYRLLLTLFHFILAVYLNRNYKTIGRSLFKSKSECSYDVPNIIIGWGNAR